MFTRQARKVGKHLLDIDDRTHRVFKPYVGTRAMQVLSLVSKLGDQPQLRLVASGLVLAGTLGGRDRLVRAGARMLIAHELATLAKDRAKINVDRTRPRSTRSREDQKPRKGKHRTKEFNSFPSGHSAGAISVARAFSREFPEHGPLAVGAACSIAALQVVRCAHYPTDVITGLAMGFVAEEASDAVWDAARMDERSTF